jgi:signal transduction histidine kinase
MSRAAAIRDWLAAAAVRTDAVFAVVVLLVAVAAMHANGSLSDGPVLARSWLVLFGAAAPLVVRRRYPWVAAPAVAVAYLLATQLDVDEVAARLPVLVMIYTAAAMLELAEAAAIAALLAAAVVVALGDAQSDGTNYNQYLAQLLTLLVCFLVGRTVHTQRAYTRALEERARTAEAGREATAREAVFSERRRIARELHDVVAHHVSVMGVMAAGARRALVRDPAAAGEALGTIEQTGRTTLRELRRLLDVLRKDDETDAALSPQPGVAGLEALVAQVREAGLPVELVVSGEPEQLDPGIDLTVFRIVQEGLTNALKHAGPATATVRVAFAKDRVELRVDDDGAGGVDGRPGAGHGLVGMRERVSLYGGTLSAGRGAGAGYSVVATIPIEPPREVRR